MIIVICGASGAGKDTLAAALERVCAAERLISQTTREPRQSDEGTSQYEFLTDSQFDDLLANDMLAEYTEYIGSGGRYGTLKSTVEAFQNSGRLGYKVSDIEGYKQLRALYPDSVFGVYLYLGKEQCRQRMIARGDTIAQVDKRTASWDQEHQQNLESLPALVDMTRFSLSDIDDVAFQIARHAEKRVSFVIT